MLQKFVLWMLCVLAFVSFYAGACFGDSLDLYLDVRIGEALSGPLLYGLGITLLLIVFAIWIIPQYITWRKPKRKVF